jgi:hypothetical protein
MYITISNILWSHIFIFLPDQGGVVIFMIKCHPNPKMWLLSMTFLIKSLKNSIMPRRKRSKAENFGEYASYNSAKKRKTTADDKENVMWLNLILLQQTNFYS